MLVRGRGTGLSQAEHINSGTLRKDHPFRDKAGNQDMKEKRIGERNAKGTAQDTPMPPARHSHPEFTFRRGYRRPPNLSLTCFAH